VTVYDGTHQTPKYVDTGVMFLSVENINTLESEKFISEEDFSREFKIYPEYGDILMTRIGDIGTPNVVRTHEKLAYYVSLALLKLKNSDSSFIAASIQSPYTQIRLWEKTLHVAFPKKINKGEIENIILYTPSKKEQSAIGNFFHALDKIIALYKRKLDGLKQLKKAYLQQMFPQEGEIVPKIRFAEFTGDWEIRKLEKMAVYKNGKGHEDKQAEDGKYELVNLNSISIDGGLKPSGKFIDETDETLLKNDLVMVLSDVGHGDLLGRVAIIPENNRFVLNQRVALLRANKTTIPVFLFYYINAHQQYFKSQGAGMSQLNISKGCVENFKSYIPVTLDEQIFIGDFFYNLDEQIATQQAKLDDLKKLKSAYLQKMFV